MAVSDHLVQKREGMPAIWIPRKGSVVGFAFFSSFSLARKRQRLFLVLVESWWFLVPLLQIISNLSSIVLSTPLASDPHTLQESNTYHPVLHVRPRLLASDPPCPPRLPSALRTLRTPHRGARLQLQHFHVYIRHPHCFGYGGQCFAFVGVGCLCEGDGEIVGRWWVGDLGCWG